MKYLSLLLISIIFPCNFSRAGLDQYTRIDIIDNWIIERKIDPSTGGISCRASMRGYGTWFGARIRLNSANELLVPEELSQKQLPDKQTLENIIKAVERCRESLIYSL